MKLCLPVLALAVLCSWSSSAQDKIFKKKGEVINGKVTKVSPEAVTYTRNDMPDGPKYMLPLQQIDKIVYENGTVDDFAGGKANRGGSSGKAGAMGAKQTKNNPGNNILSLIPGIFTGEPGGLMNDPGLGISYERLLDQNGHISVCAQGYVSFASSSDYTNYSYAMYSSYSPDFGMHHSYTIMPGLKFYPARAGATFRYAMGASMFVTFGDEPYVIYENGSSSNPGSDWHYIMYGGILTNSFSITTAKHFYVSVDLNIGVPFSDNRQLNHTFLDNPAPLFQFMVKTGARF